MKENNLEIIRKEKRESAIMAVISLTGLITAILLTPEPVPPLFGTAYGKEISDFINSIKDKIVNFEYIKENANQGFSELIAAYASTSAFFIYRYIMERKKEKMIFEQEMVLRRN